MTTNTEGGATPGENNPLPRRARWTIWLAGGSALFLAAFVWASFALFGGRSQAEAPGGSGTVEAIEIEVAPTVPGRIAAVTVDEGDRVIAGQIIARLDAAEIQAQLTQAIGQRDAAASNLRNLREGSRAEQIAAARANLQAAEAAHAGAIQGLANAERGFRHSVETRQAVDAARAQVTACVAQHAAAQRQAEALEARERGAWETLAAAEEGLATVTELRQARDAAQGQTEAARSAREQAGSSLATARADFDRVQMLFQQGAVARRDFDNARLRLDTAQAALATADAQVRTAEDTLRNATQALNDRLQARQGVITARTSRRATSREREAAQAQVRQAAAQLEGARDALASARVADVDRLQVRTARDAAATTAQTARAQVESARQQMLLLEAGNTQATLEAARGQLEAAQGAVDLAKKRLEETVIRAPRDGTVSTVVARAGETVSPGLPIVKMLDLDNAYVKVYLSFSSFGSVRIGQGATITTDAIPGEAFAGTVREMASEAEFTPKNVETRDQRLQLIYWVKVAITAPDGRLKPGMPAHATMRAGTGDGT